MSYVEYVVAAYAVFAVVLAWDFIAPKLHLRQQLRAAKLRAARDLAARNKDTGSPLSRG
jgi:heme exporter protein D